MCGSTPTTSATRTAAPTTSTPGGTGAAHSSSSGRMPMRRLWEGLSLWAAALLAVAGCASTAPVTKPPKHPEEYVLPPAEDARFSRPPQYPKGSLNNDVLLKGG